MPNIAAQRNVGPEQLARSVTGDLDWVVMKALEKERGRRYETANDFGEDIQRHLVDEPVIARPPSIQYRFQKFIKRNRTAVVASTLVSIVVAVLGFAAIWFWAQQVIANEQLAREQDDAAVNTKVLETFAQDDYRWLSPGQEKGINGSIARVHKILESTGADASPVTRGTIENVIFLTLGGGWKF